MQLSELEIVDLEPCRVTNTSTAGTWPCGNCGDQHPVQRNWVVAYRAEPVRDVRKTMVCENCADDLRRTARGQRRRIAADARRSRRRGLRARLGR